MIACLIAICTLFYVIRLPETRIVNIHLGRCKGKNLVFVPYCDWNGKNSMRCLNI